MSIRINQTIIIKVKKEEYDLLIFFREIMPYGKCQVFTKDGLPVRIERSMGSIKLGIEGKVGLDFSPKERLDT